MHRTFQIVLFLTIAFAGSTFAQTGIRDVDFDNFTYQSSCGEMEPQSLTVTKGILFEEKITTPPVQENNAENTKENVMVPPAKIVERKYFKPYEKIYGDLNGDAINEAIILTTCSKGGVESYTEGFIYGMKDGNAELLTKIEGGDRALGGLRSVKIENGVIVVERSRPGFTNNACCAEFAETMRYNFTNGGLTALGEKTSVELYPPARLQFADGETQTSLNLNIDRNDKIKRFVISGKKGKTLNISTNSPLSTVRLYRGEATQLIPQPVNKNADYTATNNLSVKLKKSEDYIFEVSNLSKESLDVTLNVEIK